MKNLVKHFKILDIKKIVNEFLIQNNLLDFVILTNFDIVLIFMSFNRVKNYR